ncbi:MAG: efflux RND transporter periplasmic adaptor subunit, partial [Anaerolineales bacterium]
MSKHQGLVSALVLTVVMLSSCTTGGTGTTSSQPTPTPIPPPAVIEKPTYTVKRGEVVKSISFTGRVSPVVEETLYFRTSGYVKRVYVERNDEVEAGTVLAELENDDLVKQLAQAQIELETSQLDLAKAQANQKYTVDEANISLNIMKLQLAKLQQSLTSAETAVKLAESALQDAQDGPDAIELEIAQRQLGQAKNDLWAAQMRRDSACGQKGVDCDSAQADVQRAEDAVRIKELELQQLQEGPKGTALLALQADYESAIESRDALKLDIQIKQQDIALKEMEVAKIAAEVDPQLTMAVERNQLAVERLQAQVADTQVISPIAGKVTSVSAYEGRQVEAYKEVFVVSDESEFEITAEPLSTQLQQLQEGMEATVVLSAYPGKEIPAKIIQLPYPYGGGGGKTLEEADKMTHLSFEPGDLALNAGDLVKVNVVIERKDNALWLPPAAIRTFSGRTFVVVQSGDTQQRVDVTMG